MLYEVQGLCVDVSYMVMGPIENNVYVVSDGAGAMVVDPSCEADRILGALRELGVRVGADAGVRAAARDTLGGDAGAAGAGDAGASASGAGDAAGVGAGAAGAGDAGASEPAGAEGAYGGVKLEAIVLTHSHWDHVDAAADLRAATGACVIASVADAGQIEHPTHNSTSRVATPCKVDRRVEHGDVVQVGNMQWKVMATPGHTKGSMCLFMVPQFGNHADGLPVLISGDTLFAGTVGRTDFEGGSMADMTASVKKLAHLPDDTVVLPGHNSLTTIGAERRRVFARFGWEPGE